MIGHLDHQCGRRADVDMHLRTVPEIDHLGDDAGDDIAIRGNLVARTVQGDALRPDALVL